MTGIAALQHDERDRLRVANRADLDPETLARLLRDPSSQVRRQALTNPQTDLATLLNARSDLRPAFVKRRLKRMVRDPVRAREAARGSDQLRWLVVRYSNDVEALDMIITESHPAMVRALCFRLGLPPEIQARLLDQEDPLLVSIIGRNPSVDPDVLVARVRAAMKRTVPRHGIEVRRRACTLLRAAAGNPAARPELLRRLAKVERWDVRAIVASHPRLPADVAKTLASDREWAVRASVAATRSSPADVLRVLGGDLHAGVKLELAANPSTPPDAVARLLVPWVGPVPWPTASFAAHPLTWVRGLAVGNPNAPRDLVHAVVGRLDAPAWVLGRAVSNPALDPASCDDIRTWLALGGGGRDPIAFDPRACTGVPVGGDVSYSAYYKTQCGPPEVARVHALWPCRRLVGDSLKHVHAVRLARDPQPQVRVRVLDFTPMTLAVLDELRLDSAPWIARRAEAAYEQQKAVRFWRRPEFRHARALPRSSRSRTRRTAWVALGAMAACWIAVAVLSLNATEAPSKPVERSTGARQPLNISQPVDVPATVREPDDSSYVAVQHGVVDTAAVSLGFITDPHTPIAWEVVTGSLPLHASSVVLTVDDTSVATGPLDVPAGATVVTRSTYPRTVTATPSRVTLMITTADDSVLLVLGE